MTVRRPVLRWHGGKWRLAPWIIQHFPPHRIYVEPFGGAASVLLRKPRCYAEVYNDLDHEVVNLFRVLRDPASAERLLELVRLTPFAREEFRLSYLETNEPIEAARRLLFRAAAGFGSNAHASQASGKRSTGFRANTRRAGTTPAQDWRSFPSAIEGIIERWRGVIIECREATEVLAQHDGPDTLHYVDPPYLPETRSPANKYDLKYRMYKHEMDRRGHARLLTQLRSLAGMVVLSGYPDPLYDEALRDWLRVETQAYADGARPRLEVLWINPQACAALERATPQRQLFAEAAE